MSETRRYSKGIQIITFSYFQKSKNSFLMSKIS